MERNIHPEIEAVTGLTFIARTTQENRLAAAQTAIGRIPGFVEVDDAEAARIAGAEMVRLLDDMTTLALDRLVDIHHKLPGATRKPLIVALAMEVFHNAGGMFTDMVPQAADRLAVLLNDHVQTLSEREREAFMARSNANMLRMLGELLSR